MKSIRIFGMMLTASLALAASSATADTLADVKMRGHLLCGVSEGSAGFETPDANNEWAGLDVAYCRAIASAIFNDPKAVRFVTSTATITRDTIVAFLGKYDIDKAAADVGEPRLTAISSVWRWPKQERLGPPNLPFLPKLRKR